MKSISRSRYLAWGLVASLAVALCLAHPVRRALSQNAGQVLTTLLGNELIQIQSQVNSTAAISYTTTANLRDGRDYLYNAPLTGATITMAVSQSAVSLNPAGTIAALTIVLPPTTFDGKMVSIYTSQTISSLTLSTSNSATFVPAAVTTLTANSTVAYVYSLAGNVWHRMQ